MKSRNCIDTNRGYEKEPVPIKGYKITLQSCECGCKGAYYYYNKIKKMKPKKKKKNIYGGKLKDGQVLEHEMFVMVSKMKNRNAIIIKSLSYTKKECLRRGIEAQWGHDRNSRFMNQTIQETWKELRRNNKWSIQKIKFKTIYKF